MKKKKIFIFFPKLLINGVSRSLISFLKELDYSKYDVDLFLCRRGGKWINEIPENVNILPEKKKYYSLVESFSVLRSEKMWGSFLLKKIAVYCAAFYYRILLRKKIHHDGLEAITFFVFSFFLPVPASGQYDLAIAFSGQTAALRKVKATHTQAWVHSDFTMLQTVPLWAWWNYTPVEEIITVSAAAKYAFDKRFPRFAKKSRFCENLLSEKWIAQQVLQFKVNGYGPQGAIRLLTVGRYTEAKGWYRIIDTAEILKQQGISFVWIGIGGGEQEKILREKIHEKNLESYLILLGEIENPYPYFEWCDFYLQPSNWEGKSMSVREAQHLGKPVIITRFGTSADQIEDGVDGIIVDMSAEAVAQAVVELIHSPEKRNELIVNIHNRDYTHNDEISNILALIETRRDEFHKREKNT